MPEYLPLFTKEFLSDRLASFELSSVVNILAIRRTIKNLNESLQSGKLDFMKEESIKSRFLMELFGDVLGFNYKNPEKWLFQEEVKTEVDGTKPDGALGHFYIAETGIKKDIRVVIEVKNTNTDLDEIQKDRSSKITPVDQAMIYATKMGEGCRWVIVTSIREIRFYRANDQTCYQRFLLNDLLQEDILKELLFLFQRENFYTGQESSTDGLLRQSRKKDYNVPDTSHIVDKLYYSLKKFDQLHFIDPNLIANMRPFNVLDEHVWHYKEGHLFTINPEIYQFLKAIS